MATKFLGTKYFKNYPGLHLGGHGLASNGPSSSSTPPPSAPVAISATSATTTSFIANWNSSTGATGYYLDVATDAGFTAFVPGYNNLNVGLNLLQSVTGLSAGITYYYRVRAYNSGGTSASSNTITQQTISAAPVATSATDAGYTNFTANWNSSTGATGYYLDVATDAGFTTFVPGYENLNVGLTLSQAITSLDVFTTYYYRVRAYNSGGTSASSNTITQQTKGFLFDNYPASFNDFAYAYFLLSSTYTGALFEIRRSSDNAVMSFLPNSLYKLGLDSLDVTQTTTLADFVGLDAFFIRAAYDQTGNGFHWTQTSAATQPKIGAAGVLYDYLDFNATNATMNSTGEYATGSLYSTFQVIQITGRVVFGPTTNNGDYYGETVSGLSGGTTVNFSLTNYYINGVLYTAPTRGDLYNALIAGQAVLTSFVTKTGLTRTARDGYTGYSNFYRKLFVAYKSDQSANRAGIEAIINELIA